MSTALTSFLDPIRLEVPGCPQPIMLFHLRRAIQQFCRYTYAWQRDLATFPLVDGDNTYSPTLPSGETDSQIIALIGRPLVTRGDTSTYYVTPKPRGLLTQEAEAWESETGATLRAVHVQHQNILRVVPTPNADADGDTVAVRVALEPKDAATNVADELYNDSLYREILEHGAMAKLLTLSGKDWSDPRAGLMRYQQFMSGLSAARVRVYQEGTGADLQVQMVSFGA
jgi:hypothetical protein